MLGSVGTTVTSGSPFLAVPIAFAAGLVSFFSPCVLPLVPGYVAFLGGSTGAAAVGAERRGGGRQLAGALVFILGFTLVFCAYGGAFGGLGHLYRDHLRTLEVVFGSVTIALGLLFAGWLPFSSLLRREARVHWLPPATIGGAGVLGVLFGLGWTPCIGPTLGAILNLEVATPGATVARGVLLVAAYCLGLGVPFVAAAIASERLAVVSRFARRHTRWLLVGGGVLLVAIGVLEVTGAWVTFIEWLQDHSPLSNYSPVL
ncbi:MAG TPA: cytochrome c biogenesis CcdA family protein [Acidimicrobiales bacterium]|nr:cytochrome c biogenesis CcdA family protein [Acidimicrobiales bacterium]